MARVDSLLDIVVQQRADELRLGGGKAPRVLRSGVQQRFAMPETSQDILRELLGPLLSAEREAALASEGRVVFAHTSGTGHVFEVRLLSRPAEDTVPGFDVVFLLRGQLRPDPPAPAFPAFGDPLARLLERPGDGHDRAALSAPPHGAAAQGGGPAANAASPFASAVPAGNASPPFAAPSTSGLPAAPPWAVAPAPAGAPSHAAALPYAAAPFAAGQFSLVSPAGTTGGPGPGVSAVVSGVSTIGPRLCALLSQAVAQGATDLHLAEGEVPSCRVDGVLRPLSGGGRAVADAAELLAEGLVGPVAARLLAGVSADYAAEVPGVGRCRVNLYRATQGLAAAIRILPAAVPEMEDVGLPPGLRDLTDLAHGLLLVCGPTGSGKSTTLAALAQEAMRRRPLLLITLEDPIEYRLLPGRPGGQVRQREVGLQVRDMVTGLRDALREDPDLLLIGEMRDAETIALALTAAETGRLVLATLHSRTATSSIERIVDSYPPERQEQIRSQLGDALRAVISQRLVPRANGRGRVPAIEVLRGTPAVATLIRERRTNQLPSAMQAGKADGMVTMERALADLVLSRQITQEAAEATTEDRASLRGYLKR